MAFHKHSHILFSIHRDIYSYELPVDKESIMLLLFSKMLYWFFITHFYKMGSYTICCILTLLPNSHRWKSNINHWLNFPTSFISETVRLQGKNWNKTLWLIHFKLAKCLLETENLHSTKEKLDKMILRVNKRSVEVFKDVKRCICVIIWSSNKRIKWTVHHGRIKGAKVIICPSFTWTQCVRRSRYESH